MLSVDQSNVRMLQRAEHERAEALMMSHRAIMQVTAAEGGPTNRCIVRWTLYIFIKEMLFFWGGFNSRI